MIVPIPWLKASAFSIAMSPIKTALTWTAY
jgi:hypothetical protein